MKKITVLGSNSGRNAGDAAILSSIISEISSLLPDVQFEVPTTHPNYIVSEYPQSMVKPVSVMPWNLSLRLLGIPVFKSIKRTDLTLITNGIVFDYRLFNLAFNFVLSLVCLVYFANKLNKPVISYNMGVGPITKKWGKRFTRFIFNRLSLITVRDGDSYRLLKEIGIKNPIEITADSSFVNRPCSQERIRRIFQKEKMVYAKKSIGINVTSYLSSWLGSTSSSADSNRFQNLIARLADDFIENFDVDVVFFATQIMDIGFTKDVINRTTNKNRVSLISNDKYTNQEMMGIMGKMEIFIGMRLHSLILSSAMLVPVVGLVYAPKVRSYLKLIGQSNRSIELIDLDYKSLYSIVAETMKRRKEIKSQLTPEINNLKTKAHESAKKIVNEFLS